MNTTETQQAKLDAPIITGHERGTMTTAPPKKEAVTEQKASLSDSLKPYMADNDANKVEGEKSWTTKDGQFVENPKEEKEEEEESTHTTEVQSTLLDLTPESVEEWNKKIKGELAGTSQGLSNDLKAIFGGAAPTVELEMSVEAGKVEADATKGASEAVSVSDAEFKASAKIGWTLALSEILSPTLGDDWNKLSLDLNMLGETLPLEGEFDASLFLGAESSFSITVGSGEAITAAFKGIKGAIFDGVSDGVKEEAKVAGEKTASKAKSTDGVPKVAGSEGDESAKKKAPIASIGGEGELFIGAKAEAGAEAAIKWKRKESAEYVQSLDSIIELISSLSPALMPLMPLYSLFKSWYPDLMSKNIAPLIFGAADAEGLNLFSAEAKVEGSAGAGAKGNFKLSFDGGEITFAVAGSASIGLGGGAETKIAADPLEIGRLGLVMGGAMWELVKKYANEGLGKLGSDIKTSITESVTGFWTWLGADDKVREVVAAGAHKGVPAKERGEMITTLMGGWTGGTDEKAILTIIRDSMALGDVQEVLANVNGVTNLSGNMHGESWAELVDLTKDMWKRNRLRFETTIGDNYTEAKDVKAQGGNVNVTYKALGFTGRYFKTTSWASEAYHAKSEDATIIGYFDDLQKAWDEHKSEITVGKKS